MANTKTVRVRAWSPQTVKNDEAGMLHVIHYEKQVCYSTELRFIFGGMGLVFPGAIICFAKVFVFEILLEGIWL